MANLKPLGPDRKLNPEQRGALIRLVENGPIPAVHGVVRWRLVDLVQWIWDEFGISFVLDRLDAGRNTQGVESEARQELF